MDLVRGIKSAFNAFMGYRAGVVASFMNNTIYGHFENIGHYIKHAYQKNADVYSIVSYIAAKVAMAPAMLYEIKDEKAFRKYKALTSNPTKASLQKADQIRTKAMTEVEGEHPLLKLLNNQVNDEMNASEFKYACAVYRLLTGNTYIHGFAPEAEPDRFVELHILPSQFTHPISAGQYLGVKAYRLDYDVNNPIDKANVAHYRYFNPDFSTSNPHIVGQAPLMAASNVVLRSNSGYESSTKAFQNGGKTGVLYEDGNAQLSDTQRDLLQAHIDKKMTGPGNYKQIIAASSKLGWLEIGSSPVDLGILESLVTDLRSLCNVFHVNSALFNDPENKTYNNMQEARKAAITDAVLPELTALRDALNQWLVPGWSKADKKRYFLDFDTSVYPELQEDMKALAEWLEKAWWIDPNEKRAQMNYDAKGPEFDECFIPAGIMPMSQSDPADFEKAFHKVGSVDYD
jgi:HK97 family phage portal protein